MEKIKNNIVCLLLIVCTMPLSVFGQEGINSTNEISQEQYNYCLKCLYKNDTIAPAPIQEPRKDAVEMSRATKSVKYVYKNEWLFGLTASYGALDGDNANYFVLLDDVDLSGKIASFKPFVAYAYSDNNCVGLRYGYNRLNGNLKSSTLNLGENNGITLDIPKIELDNKFISYGLFHRSYVALDPKGKIGLFADIELSYSYGTTVVAHNIANITPYSKNVTQSYDINFNPGMSVYIFPMVETTFSIGFGGLGYYTIKQYDNEGNFTGVRRSSNMSFNLNLFAINLGVVVHLW